MPTPGWFASVSRDMNSRSFDSWEVYRETREIVQTTFNLYSGKTVRRGSLSGIAVRAVKNGSYGFAYGDHFNNEKMIQCAERVSRNLSLVPMVRDIPVFADPWDISNTREYCDPVIDDPDRIDRLTHLIMDRNDRHRNIEIIERALIHEKISRHLVNSSGTDVMSEETLFTESWKGMLQTCGEKALIEDESSSRFSSGLSIAPPEALMQVSSSCPAEQKNHTKEFTGDLIIVPIAARLWLSHWTRIFRTERKQHAGMFTDGKVPIDIIISDDRTLPNAPGSVIFDGEGYPARRDMVFNNTLHNLCELKPQSDRDEQLMPRPMPGNLHIQNGDQSVSDMIRSIRQGMMIFKLFTVNSDSSQDSIAFGFEGFMINSGELSSLCSGVTESLTPFQWITKLTGVGNDLVVNNRVSSPTLKFSDMKVKVY